MDKENGGNIWRKKICFFFLHREEEKQRRKRRKMFGKGRLLTGRRIRKRGNIPGIGWYLIGPTII